VTGATELDMLWEPVDPVAALAARFGFTDAGHAVSELATVVREAWGGRLDRCDRLVISASNLLAWLTVDGRPVVAKCSADRARFSRLAEVDDLVAWLHSRDVPVAAPSPAPDGRLRVEREGFSIALHPLVRGRLLDVDDAGQVEAAGRALATLHEELAAYPRPIGEEARPGEQLVHGDFRSANVLYDAGRITGILDFDEVGSRSRIADLAKAAVLLGTRYHDWAPTSPETRTRFVAAYAEEAPLTEAQQDELDRAIAAVLNHFGWT